MLLSCKRKITFCMHLTQVPDCGGRAHAGQLYICMLQDFFFSFGFSWKPKLLKLLVFMQLFVCLGNNF